MGNSEHIFAHSTGEGACGEKSHPAMEEVNMERGRQTSLECSVRASAGYLGQEKLEFADFADLACSPAPCPRTALAPFTFQEPSGPQGESLGDMCCCLLLRWL
eukprot:753572-Hanusia_phi.AAC.13